MFKIDGVVEDINGGEVKKISITPVSGDAGVWIAVPDEMAFETDIVNFTGGVLPNTGGICIYVFYFAGAAIVITVGAVMASRKKAEEEKPAWLYGLT